MAKDQQFLSFLVPAWLLKDIDAYQDNWRFNTRAAAIRHLLTWAVQQNPDARAARGRPPGMGPKDDGKA